MDWKKWFDRHKEICVEIDSNVKHANFAFTEIMYQAFISRMIDEGYIRPQMTPEEYAEWKQKMVTKPHPDLQK